MNALRVAVVGAESAAPHLTVDNRLTAARPLRDQIVGLAAQAKDG